MNPRMPDPIAPFQSIRKTARLTGLSAYYLRAGCKDGSVPHIMVGAEYRVNVPLLMDRLNAESAASCEGRNTDED